MPHIQSLRLTDFRSYPTLDLKLSRAPVVLYGPNGAGKTNLIEAVSFLSPGRGLRRAKLDDIARKYNDGEASPAWGVSAHISADHEPLKLSVGQVPEYPRRRIIRIDDKNVTGTELAACLTLMWLTPAQDRLFTGPASDRRKFLDRLTLVHAPDHGMHVSRYEKARSERNRLLSERITDAGWYNALESDMAVHGARIAIARVHTTTRLTEEINGRENSPFPKASIKLEGSAEEMHQDGMPLDTIYQTISEQLSSNRSRDLHAGRTLDGVHKTNLRIRYIAKNMAAEDCSTGEQKALLIGLTLAHARAQSEKEPILLLDEVAAHLDEGRRASLIEELLDLNTQIFMTGTDASLFNAFAGRAQMFSVSEGRVTLDE